MRKDPRGSFFLLATASETDPVRVVCSRADIGRPETLSARLYGSAQSRLIKRWISVYRRPRSCAAGPIRKKDDE